MLQELGNGVCYDEVGQKVLLASKDLLVIFHLSFFIFHLKLGAQASLLSQKELSQ